MKQLWLAFAAVVALAALSASAQDLPPDQRQIDANGVNLINADFTFSRVDVSVGPNNRPLTFTRNYAGMRGYSDNNAMYYIQGNPAASGVKTVYVVGAGLSDSFSCNGSGSSATCTSLAGNGSQLIVASYDGDAGFTYNYIQRDGTVFLFDNFISAYVRDGNYMLANSVARKITYPDGYSVVIGWAHVAYGTAPTVFTIFRISGVSDSRGYLITPRYLRDTGVTSSNFTEYLTLTSVYSSNDNSCSTNSTGCAGSAGMPYMIYNSTAGFQPPASTTDALGNVTTFTYDASNNITGITRPGHTTPDISITYVTNTTGLSYTPGYLVNQYTVGGQTWTYTFVKNGSNSTTTRTDPLSNHIQVNTTALPPTRIASYVDELTRTTSYTYDGNNRVQTIVAPEGNYVQYTYDGRGNVTQTTRVSKTPGTPASLITTANFDASCANVVKCNQPNWTRDANGNQTDYGYDPTSGLLTSTTSPAPTIGAVRPQTRYGYTSLQAFKTVSGSVISNDPILMMTSVSACQTTASCAGTADEQLTTTTYATSGAFSNLSPATVSSGAGNGSLTATTALAFDLVGNPYTVDGPLGGTADVTRYRYDAARQLVGVVGPDPDGAGPLLYRAIRTTYNPDGTAAIFERGTVPSQSDADWPNFVSLRQVTTAYDNAARKSRDTLTASGVTFSIQQYSYDAEGRLDCATVRMNPALFSSSLPGACMASAVGSFGPDRIKKYGYDSASQVTSTITAYGTGAAQTQTLTYTGNGKLKTVADGKNNLTSYVYDGLDRLSQTQFPSPTTPGTSNPADYEQPSYDSNGNVTARRLRNGASITYGFDALNRLTSKTLPAGNPNLNASFAYDLLNRMSGTSNGNGIYNTSVAFTYDALGRKTSETNGLNGVTKVKTMQYDLAGHRTLLDWGDGIAISYDYDPTGEMTAIRENGATTGIGVLATFGYDNLGQRLTLVRGNGTTTGYTYDPASRLTSLAQDLGGTADDLTITLANYSPANEIGSHTASNDNYAFPAPGNGTSSYTPNGLNQYNPAAGQGTTYDPRGNMTGLGSNAYTYSAENQLALVGTVNRLYYDPLFRLVYSTSSATRFDWDNNADMTTIYDGSNNLLRRFVHGPNDDEPLVWYEGSGTADRRWLHADERGSIVAISNAAGLRQYINAYDEYGIPKSGNTGRFQYTGQIWLPELGMYYYKARIYAPAIGRFMQTDPVGFDGGLNLYNYAGSDPINGSDPNGLDPDDQEIVVKGKIPATPGAAMPSISIGGASSYAFCNGSGCQRGTIAPSVPQTVTAEIVVVAARAARRAVGFTLELGAALYDAFQDPLCCFTAGTQISTPSGLKAIETLKVGDLVISRDDKTNETAVKPIVKIAPPHERRVWAVTISYKDENGHRKDERYNTTDDHPWHTADGHWVNSAALKHGQMLSRKSGTAVVVNVGDTGESKLTYNLEISDFHTYFVGEAQTWVHNQCIDNKLIHIFGNSKHQLKPLVDRFGDTKAAFDAVQAAANSALASGHLVVGPNGILPTAGNVLNVGGVLIQLSGGRVADGSVQIGSFSAVIRQ